MPDEVKEAQRTKLAGRFNWLSQQLEGKDYLTGSQFTVADAYLFTVLRWSGPSGIDLGKWPVLSQYTARVAARPKVQAALKAQGLA
jgi:glutathione S-transferase